MHHTHMPPTCTCTGACTGVPSSPNQSLCERTKRSIKFRQFTDDDQPIKSKSPSDMMIPAVWYTLAAARLRAVSLSRTVQHTAFRCRQTQYYAKLRQSLEFPNASLVGFYRSVSDPHRLLRVAHLAAVGSSCLFQRSFLTPYRPFSAVMKRSKS